MPLIPFSPHKDLCINENNTFNFKEEEISEMYKNQVDLENDALKKLDNSKDILRAILWNSKGETKSGYAAFRMELSKTIIKDFNFDLFITQEPVSVVDKNYIGKYFNNEYGIIFPVKLKARKEVAIVYRKEKIKVLKNEDPYELIEQSRRGNDKIDYPGVFISHGKGRIQITHFKTKTKPQTQICVFNIHSVYKFKDQVKKDFILSFFKFVKWYINKILSPKGESFNLLVAGDFNNDIFSNDFPELIFNEIGLQISLPSPPTIDSFYDEKEIAPSNIDYFVSVHHAKNSLNVNNVRKLPIRFINYQNNFEGVAELRENKNLVSFKVSTHDPQFCCLSIKS
ncbi:hypothetical protein ACTFIZ_002804 [Dictyostelium cf. discoideum]